MLIPLPYYLTTRVIIIDGSKRVEVTSRIHVNKVVLLEMWWSPEFTDEEVLSDARPKIEKMYGLKMGALRYE